MQPAAIEVATESIITAEFSISDIINDGMEPDMVSFAKGKF